MFSWPRRLLLACILLGTLQDAPPAPAPAPTDLVPVSILTGPDTIAPGGQVFLGLGGSVSASDPDIAQIDGPESVAVAQLYDKGRRLVYVVAQLNKPGQYRFACVTFGRGNAPARAYAFKFVVVPEPVDPSKPKPPSPGPTPPTPPPSPPATPEVFGLTKFTRSMLDSMAWPAEAKRTGAAALAKVFASAATNAATYPSAQALSDATAATCKSALGNAYTAWSVALIKPLEGQWTALNLHGKLLTPAELGQAYAEIAQALREVN